MYKRYICFLLIFLLLCFSLSAAPIPSIQAEGAILIEPRTNTILYAKNANKQFYPASTTKILTALILLEDLPADTIITKTKDSISSVPSDSSQIPLKVGDQYTASDGLYAVLLASDNFVAHDMAIKDAGSISAFAQKMNDFAKSNGALSSHFVNPHGYHDPAHYTTPYDLSQIGRAAFSNPNLLKLTATFEHTLVTRDGKRTIPLKHTAVLLNDKSPFYNPSVVGAKTGFHTPAKRTLIVKATYDNIELIGVIMRSDSPNQFKDMNTLLEYGRKSYSLSTHVDELGIILNHSYSPWAKSSINSALNEGWLAPSTKNYRTPITRREFVTLLKAAVPENYRDRLDPYIDFDGDSIYNENLITTRQEVAQITYNLLQEISIDSIYVPVTTNILDQASIPAAYKTAIDFVVTTGLLGQNNTAFNPDSFITYEQAIAFIHRLIPVIETYASYESSRLLAFKFSAQA